MRLMYLAHPVAADEEHTIREHAELAATYLRAVARGLTGTGWSVVAPWLGTLWAMGMTEPDVQTRVHVLRVCAEQVRRCDALLLCGHRMSYGMWDEHAAARYAGVPMLGLVGRSPQVTADAVRRVVTHWGDAVPSSCGTPACQEAG